MKNKFLILAGALFLSLCLLSCKNRGNTDAKESPLDEENNNNTYVIANSAEKHDVELSLSEKVYILPPGQCVALKGRDFFKLSVNVVDGGLFAWDSEQCDSSDDDPEEQCKPGNYEIDVEDADTSSMKLISWASPDGCLNFNQLESEE